VRSPVGGFEAFALALADFDRDGKLDVVVADVGTQEVTVFRGDGLGGFTFLSRQATGGDAISIAAGDFNSDGSPDVIVTNLVAGTVLLLLGDGHGGLAPAPGSPYTPKGCCSGSSSLPESVAVGDFNGDGNADAAVTLRSGVSGPEVALLLGDGRGHLSPASGTPVPAGGRFPSSVAVGDLNGDGRPDLVTANFLSDTVSVLINYKNAQALCEALRASMGDSAFARRYGTNANEANAFGQCVKQNKEF
jgi:hypothetical protein